jgi:hypothetical protein
VQLKRRSEKEEVEAMPLWTSKKVKDLACGPEIDPKKAAATHYYRGKTYHFCARRAGPASLRSRGSM